MNEVTQETSQGTQRERIIQLLRGTGRGYMDQMIEYLKESDFFEAPASTRFHGDYPGGLAEHSLRVFELLESHASMDLGKVVGSGQKPLPLEHSNLVVAGLLHDVCKIGAYIPTPGEKSPYRWDKAHPKGHATLSIEVVKKYIVLMPIEELMIRYHMGFYGMYEYYEPGSWEYKTQAEYHLRSQAKKPKNPTPEEKKADQKARYGKSWRNAVYHNPVAAVMFFCDMMASLEQKGANKNEVE